MFVMVGCMRDELSAMRSGLTDIIPPELLEGLTAEDFQLLLSGDSASISLQRLKSVMKFNHTHGRSQGICDRFEKLEFDVKCKTGIDLDVTCTVECTLYY